MTLQTVYFLFTLAISVSHHSLGSAASVTAESSPPLIVLDSFFNDLDDIREFDLEGLGFTTDATKQITATLESSQVPLPELYLLQNGIEVDGSLNCLIGFWRFLESTPRLTYADWISPALDREECNYTIGFQQCPQQNLTNVDLVVMTDINAVVDGNPGMAWAHPITPGQDIIIKLDLQGMFKVAALALKVETVPLELTIGISSNNGAVRNLVRLQQESCDESMGASGICQPFFRMKRNILTLDWDYQSDDEITGDQLHITLHGVQCSGPYSINYQIVREITLLAKAVAAMPPTTSEPAPQKKGMREILLEYRRRVNPRY